MFDVVVLAAGKGSRMKSRLPKVMHPLAGKPMVQWAVDAATQSGANQVHLVVGFGREFIEGAVSAPNVQFALQEAQLGTGHAVAQALPAVKDSDVIVVTYGDVPLLKADTIAQLAAVAESGHLALLTEVVDDPSGYGRIIRDETSGAVISIVEHKDASDAQRAVREINTGVMAAPAAQLREWLPQLSVNNAQGEYYLTDIVALAVAAGVPVYALHPAEGLETTGVNSRQQLAALERAVQRRQVDALMAAGVGFADPSRVDIRGELVAEGDVFIDVNCVFEGRVTVQAGAVIGPHCVVRDSVIGCDCRVESHSVLEGSRLGEGVVAGPFARLRPGTALGARAKVGNFVEVKKSQVGEGSKINHLSYVGDADIGSGVNVGAGVITCNYDGANKHLTSIADGAFIGSNCSLVAPVDIGANVTVGAGSVLTQSVPDEHLAVARGRQRNISGWRRPVKGDA